MKLEYKGHFKSWYIVKRNWFLCHSAFNPTYLELW